MPIVQVKGVANPMQFPDDMDITDIREFLKRRFANLAVSGNQQLDLNHIQSTAQAYEPSLAEKTGQGISNFLYDQGIISDRYGAQRIGDNVTTMGEFLPVIGDATAGDEFGRALKQGDGVGMAIGALGAIPIAGDFAKKGAKKAKKIIDNDFEYHLSTEPDLEIGKSFSEQKRTVSSFGERGDGGVDDKVIFSTKDPQDWLDQFEMELGQDAPEAIPRNLYKVRVKNKSEGGYLSEAINKPSDVVILEKVSGNDSSKPDFMMNMPVYHGTNKDLTKFDLSKTGKVSGSSVRGVSVTTNKEVAEEYSKMASKASGTPTVIELVHRAEKPAMIELDGTEKNLEMAATIEDLWDNGYDAVMLKNYKNPNGKGVGNVIIVKDPSQLRKPNAKFDAKEKFNPNLLAGVGGVALISSGAYQQE